VYLLALLLRIVVVCRSLTQMGTQRESFVELTERIGRKTGGISVSPFISDRRGSAEPVALVMLSGKAMGDKAADLFDLFRDVLLTARLDDQERFKQVGPAGSATLKDMSPHMSAAFWAVGCDLQHVHLNETD
jgi:Zn-dependent M16 (insulinase) family peptidase